MENTKGKQLQKPAPHVYKILHDVATPLTYVLLLLESLQNDVKKNQRSNTDLQITLEKAIKGLHKITDIIRENEVSSKNISLFSLSKEIQNVISVCTHRLEQNHVKVIFTPYTNIKIKGSPTRFFQLALNLVNNAIDSFSKNASLKKEIIITLSENTNDVVLTIQDNGIGIDKKYLSQIFTPFFTTKKDNHSRGLGLSICKEIIEDDFSGSWEIKSTKKRGTKVFVTIPK